MLPFSTIKELLCVITQDFDLYKVMSKQDNYLQCYKTMFNYVLFYEKFKRAAVVRQGHKYSFPLESCQTTDSVVQTNCDKF